MGEVGGLPGPLSWSGSPNGLGAGTGVLGRALSLWVPQHCSAPGESWVPATSSQRWKEKVLRSEGRDGWNCRRCPPAQVGRGVILPAGDWEPQEHTQLSSALLWGLARTAGVTWGCVNHSTGERGHSKDGADAPVCTATAAHQHGHQRGSRLPGAPQGDPGRGLSFPAFFPPTLQFCLLPTSELGGERGKGSLPGMRMHRFKCGV